MEEEPLSREMIDRLCTMLRFSDFFNDHPEEIAEMPELQVEAERFKVLVKQLWDNLSDAQRDELLEEHKRQKDQIAREEAEKAKQKKTEGDQ